ncbi:bacterio-opsin activator domain-containing protein [Haloparvum sp. AD34]
MTGEEARILLVEDNPGDARYIRTMLEEAMELSERTVDRGDGNADERVLSTEDGSSLVHEQRLSAGLDRLESTDFDVVLLDLGLPDSKGMNTLTTLVEEFPMEPVVVLTGLSDREVGTKALRQGADEYLVKDEISPDLLIRSVYHAIERQAHRREQRRYATLIEESTDVNAILDPDGTFQYLTPSVEHVLGYEADELVGERVFDYLHPDDHEPTKREFATLIESPDDRANVEFRFEHADGTWVDLSARGRNLLDDPAIEGIVVYTHDVTERKERERQLESQRERLAALNQLNGVVHGVTEAVIEQSTREEIERIACERLADSSSYEFAWVGRPDPKTQTIDVTAEAGVEGYLDDVTISMDPNEEAGQGPTGRAIREAEIQTTQNIHSDPRHEPWQDVADEYGYRSSAAIPIMHEGTLYGVLNVYADRPEAFRDEERAVVEYLGEIIGHAIAAVDRKRALMSESVVELEFRIQNAYETYGIEAMPEDTVTLSQVVPVSDDEFLMYGSVPEDSVDAVERIAEGNPTWESITILDEDVDEVRFEVRMTDATVMSRVASLGGSVESVIIENGDLRMTVHLPQEIEVRRVIDAVQNHFPQAEPLARRQITDPDDHTHRLKRIWTAELTDRQRTVLETAYYSGYFEWPRSTSGEDVAESLGISAATFSEHLRAAENKVFGGLVGDEDVGSDS